MAGGECGLSVPAHVGLCCRCRHLGDRRCYQTSQRRAGLGGRRHASQSGCLLVLATRLLGSERVGLGSPRPRLRTGSSVPRRNVTCRRAAWASRAPRRPMPQRLGRGGVDHARGDLRAHAGGIPLTAPSGCVRTDVPTRTFRACVETFDRQAAIVDRAISVTCRRSDPQHPPKTFSHGSASGSCR